MLPWRVSGGILEVRSLRNGTEEQSDISFGRYFGVIWTTFGVILESAGRQGALKIHHFAVKMYKKMKKLGPGRSTRKSLNFERLF